MNNLDRQYQSLLLDIISNGIKKGDRTGTGTISVFGRQIRHKMSEGFPLLTTKKMHWKSIVVELLWFLRGDTNIKYLIDNDVNIWNGDTYKNYLNSFNPSPLDMAIFDSDPITKELFIAKIKANEDFAKAWGELGPIYGKQWRSWRKSSNEDIDQIATLIYTLKNNPDDRRMMVSAWNVGEIHQMVLPPCHYGFQCWTRELTYNERCDLYVKKYGEFDIHPFQGKDVIMDGMNIPKRELSLMWNQRSVDTFLGLPFNIASYGLLLEILCKIVNMVPGELIGNLGDTHLYSNHIEQALEQINRNSFSLPKLRINTEFWPTESGECGVGNLVNNFDWLIKGMEIDDFQIEDYKSHPAIKAELSN